MSRFSMSGSGGQRYARSMFSSGSSVRMSLYGASHSNSFDFGASVCRGDGEEMGITANKKTTMQNLNVRLATFLDKVKALEKANAETEQKIRMFLEGKSSPLAGDYSAYYVTIAELQEKIQDAISVNGGIYLSIDNSKLAADDFRLKYENELAMRSWVESEIAGLKMVLEEMSWSRSDLEMQIECLKEELNSLKKNHEEELMVTKSKISGQVNVEVDTPDQQDLATSLEEVRNHYEQLTNKNLKHWETWFQQKSETLNKEMSVSVETTNTEVTDLKRMYQSLEIDLQSQFSMKACLANSVAETQNSYGCHLMNFQQHVTRLGDQLLQLKEDIERQSTEYQILLDTKTKLEMEIAEYRRLLEGDDGACISTESSSPHLTTKKKIIIVQEVDGKEVSSSIESTQITESQPPPPDGHTLPK